MMPIKVNSRWPTSWLLIALHSPRVLSETGLSMCPSEKSQLSDRVHWWAVRSLQSGLSRTNREIWACFAHSVGNRGRNSLQFGLRGGVGRIRTLGPGLNGVRADVCVSCAESPGTEILQQTACSPFDTLNSPVSDPIERRMAGDTVAESGLCRRLPNGQMSSH
jgi:hypothetical protein